MESFTERAMLQSKNLKVNTSVNWSSTLQSKVLQCHPIGSMSRSKSSFQNLRKISHLRTHSTFIEKFNCYQIIVESILLLRAVLMSMSSYGDILHLVRHFSTKNSTSNCFMFRQSKYIGDFKNLLQRQFNQSLTQAWHKRLRLKYIQFFTKTFYFLYKYFFICF